MEEDETARPANEFPEFSAHLKKAWCNERTSDVVLQLVTDSGQLRLRLHRIILECGSEYFRSLFSENWNRDVQRCEFMHDVRVDVPELAAHAVEISLKHLYGFTPALDSVSLAMEVFQAASFFGLERLRGHVERYILKSLSSSCESALENLAIALPFFRTRILPGDDAVLAACKSVLLRTAHAHPEILLSCGDLDLIRDVLTDRCFCVPGTEYARFQFLESLHAKLAEAESAAAAGPSRRIRRLSAEAEEAAEEEAGAGPCTPPPAGPSQTAETPDSARGPAAKRPRTRPETPDGREAAEGPLPRASSSSSAAPEPGLGRLWEELMGSVQFASFSFEELLRTRRKYPRLAALDEHNWGRDFIRLNLTRPAGAAPGLEGENLERFFFRTCVPFRASRLGDPEPGAASERDVFSDPFLAFGNFWQVRVSRKSGEERSTISVHIHRISASRPPPGLAAPVEKPEYCDDQLFRKFKFSIAIPLSRAPRGQWPCREGSADFALKEDPRLARTDLNKYGWGWDNVVEYRQIAEVASGDTLFVLVTLCPAFAVEATQPTDG
eukprot:tig00001094_g6976.t1